jgi:2-oxoisovalerate dehydrogenase E1 component beta subunit
MLHTVLKAEKAIKEQGISLEIINLRTLLPWDAQTVIQSVEKTGRALIVHEAPKTCGFGGEISATIMEKAFFSLQAPVLRVTGWDTPFPYSLENEYLPSPARIQDACKKLMES